MLKALQSQQNEFDLTDSVTVEKLTKTEKDRLLPSVRFTLHTSKS